MFSPLYKSFVKIHKKDLPLIYTPQVYSSFFIYKHAFKFLLHEIRISLHGKQLCQTTHPYWLQKALAVRKVTSQQNHLASTFSLP